MKNKYYAYFVPRTRGKGITDNWKNCEKMVKGETGARFKGFSEKKEAEEWLKKGANYDSKKELESGIYFDAGTGRGNGVEVSVVDENGNNLLADVLPKKELNEFGKYLLKGGETNNYGELLACKFALKIAIKKKAKKVFGDSKLVINYWSKGSVKEENFSREFFELVDSVMDLRKKFEKKGGVIIHLPGKDNPADLGFHR
ncbi:MAG: reverse transcriptase-like protein [Spirochaetia bacterium]|nr:MAG: reverse transcriptase-like protein [Spirochaetia bacterium]